MENKSALEELRKPHPNQERIDTECARLLLSTAQRPGGSEAWISGSGNQHAPAWPQPEPVHRIPRR